MSSEGGVERGRGGSEGRAGCREAASVDGIPGEEDREPWWKLRRSTERALFVSSAGGDPVCRIA